MDFRSLLGKRIIICDGGMGTMMQKYGLPTGVLPETINFTHPEIIERIYAEYLSAGSDFVSTNTFGANRLKTENTGYSVDEIVTRAVAIARQAVKTVTNNGSEGSKYVALDIGPIGRLLTPAGDLSFEEACSLYREQIIPALKAGVDLIFFETFTDLYEMKAAAVTARELTDLPVFCSVTFQENGRMLMGADPLTAVNTIQDLGIDAIGVNCSLGPRQMIPIVREILKYSKLPVLVQPNAGLPRIENGKTVYDVDIEEYTSAMKEMILAGASIVGGCCGTTPKYIKSLTNCVKLINDGLINNTEYNTNFDRIRTGHKKATAFNDLNPVVNKAPAAFKDISPAIKKAPITAVSSATKTVIFDDRIRIIGERINPTGKKLLRQAIKEKDFTYIENEAVRQVKAGADILDINVGLPEIDEMQTIKEVIARVSSVVDAPLQIDSADPKVIEAAARYYNGKPVINSVSGKQDVMDAIFPIVKKYGTCVVALTLDEKGLPQNTEERVAIAERIINEASGYGIGRERIIVDCLTLTVSAQQSAARDTLEAIRIIKTKFGVRTTLGASNVSFGLPERRLLNRTFLAMALEAGLDAPITDPLVPEYMDTIRAFETLSCKDTGSEDFIAYYGASDSGVERTCDGPKSEIKDPADYLTEIIINGYEDRAAGVTEELLKVMKPLEIIEQIIIPALETVGRDYETGVKFLPQLMHSAETVKNAFKVLKAVMESAGEKINYGKIILATVKGDIHDIGKNIVRVILENYGYEVIDLGKDTDIELIVETAKKENIRLVGLSALMTTTVVSMEATIKALREAGVTSKVAVGGAVLNAGYAAEIKADYYCKDAMDAVRVANSIFKGETE